MSQFREQSFLGSQFNSKESLLPKSDVEKIKRKREIIEARANELRSDGSFSSDIPEKQSKQNNEARKKRAVLARGVATRQLDTISDSHNRRLEREMRPAGVPTGSGPSHTAEVDALLRGGIPREAWNSDSVVPGSMDDPKRSTASLDVRRKKQVIAVTPDHRRLEEIAAPNFFVSEDDDDDDSFDEERTTDGESFVSEEEDEYSRLARKYGITLPEEKPLENEVDQEISLIAKGEEESALVDNSLVSDFSAPGVTKQGVSESINSSNSPVIGSSRHLQEMAKREFPVQKRNKTKIPQKITPKREVTSGLADVPVSERESSFQSGGRNVRISMDHRKTHKQLNFTPDDIVIQPRYESGFRQETPQKGKETGRRKHLKGLKQQFERGGLLNLSHIPREKIKIVGGSRRNVEFIREKKVDTKPKEETQEDDANEGYISADQRYELAVRKTPEILEYHNRKQKFVHKILDWDLDAIELRDFTYKIPFEKLDSVNPTEEESEAIQDFVFFKEFRGILKSDAFEKKSKIYHEMFLILHDFYRAQGDILQKKLGELFHFTDSNSQLIQDFSKCNEGTTNIIISDLIKKLTSAKVTIEEDIKRSYRSHSRIYEIPRCRFFLKQVEELIEELGRIKQFFQK